MCKKEVEEELSKEELREAQIDFERRQRPEFQKIDFFLSARSGPRPEHSLREIQDFIISALKDERRREDMLFWLWDKFSSSYDISKIPDLWDGSRPSDRSYDAFTPARERWKLLYWEACGAHQWQITSEYIWDPAGDPSDVDIQIYENGYVVLARTHTDVRGFRL